MSKWIAEFELEDGDTMPEHMDLEYKGVRIDFHCKPQEPTTKNDLGVDAISRQEAIDAFPDLLPNIGYNKKAITEVLQELPSVTPQDIDYKAQYERLSKKAEIVISQLRADRDRLMSLTSVTPQKPTSKNDLGVECISRDSAIKALDYDIDSFEFKSGVSKYMNDIAKLLNTIYEIQVNNIKALPSVTPQDIDYKAQYERLSQKAEIVISQLRADRDRLIRPKGHWIGNYQVDFGEWQEYDVKLSDGFVTDNCHCSECGEELLSGDRGMFCPYCGSDNREVEE